MRTSGTNISATGHKAGLGNALYDKAGARPDLDLDFARNKSLKDKISKEDLITFTRSITGNTTASRTTGATYVDEKGYINRAGGNLVKYSEDFSQSSWTKTGSTITSNNVVAPDGTLTADTWSADATGYGLLYTPTGGSPAWIVDPGSSGTTYSDGLFSANNFTSNWARLRTLPIVVPANSNGYVVLYPLQVTGSGLWQTIQIEPGEKYIYSAWYKKVGTKIYVWGVQFELEKNYLPDSHTLTSTDPLAYKFDSEYVKTGAQPSGAPRFTHDPITKESKGLLIEQQATNLATQSEALATWPMQGGSLVTDANVANPDGKTGAVKYIPNTTAAYNHIVYFANTTTGNIALSLFVRPAGLNHVNLISQRGSSTSRGVNFNLTEGSEAITASLNANGVIEKYPNGWYRIIVIPTTTGATDITHYVINPHDGTAVTTTNYFRSSYGNSNTTNGMYLWGAQHEVGTTATSYIPTSGSTVTRSPDLVSIEGDNFGTYRQNLKPNTVPNNVTYTTASGSSSSTTNTKINLQPYVAKSPYGTYDASLIIEDNQSGVHELKNPLEIVLLNSTVYTVSCYVKEPPTNSRRYVGIALWGNDEVVFDIQNGTYLRTEGTRGITSHAITPVGNDWYRISMVLTSRSDQNAPARSNVYVILDNGTAQSYVGDGTKGMYVWGIQVELGNTLTEFIPSTDTFDNRQSNATFVDGNGIIRRSMCNELKYSEEFDNSYWSKGQLSVSANAGIAPNGTQTADKVIPTTVSSSSHFIYKAINPGGAQSIYAKADGYNHISLVSQLTGQSPGAELAAGVSVNLTNGSVHDIKDGTAEVIDVGNGWYRITFSRTDNQPQVYYLIQPHDGTEAPNHDYFYRRTYAQNTGETKGILLWGAMQTNDLTEAGDYYKTTDTISGPPRYSHDPETLTPTGLYLEPAASNNLDNSTDKTNSPDGVDIFNNVATAPDGTNTARRLSDKLNNVGRHKVHITGGGSASTSSPRTISCFFKNETRRYVGLQLHGSSADSQRANIIDLQEGVITEENQGTNYKLEKYPNGWYRFSFTITHTTNGNFTISLSNSPNIGTNLEFGSPSYTGEGKSILFWGMQSEVGETATSYIPTSGAAANRNADIFKSTATEVLDRANGTKPAFYTKSGISFFTQGTYTKDNLARRFFEFKGHTASQFSLTSVAAPNNPKMGLYQANVTLTDSSGNNYTSALGASNMAPAGNTTSDDKFAARFEFNNSILFTNGTGGNTDQTCDTRSSTELYIGNWHNADPNNHRFLGGTIQRLTFWKTPFVNSKLKRLTF